MSIIELYNCYEVLNNNEETAENKKVAYDKIIDAANGNEKEKRLASQFITKFFKFYPDLYELSFNKLLDLSEEDNVAIRKQVIQVLPAVGKDVSQYLPKIVDTLTQMLVSNDQSEVLQLYSALNTCLKLDLKVTVESIFDQLSTQLVEAKDLINTNAIKYLNETLTSGLELLTEMELFIDKNATILLTKLAGKNEYSLIIDILLFLKLNSTLQNRQKLINIISEQTQSLGYITDLSTVTTLKNYCKEITKLLSRNVHADEVLTYLLNNIIDITKIVVANDKSDLFEIFKYIVSFANTRNNADTNIRASLLTFSDENGLKCLKDLFEVCFDNLPSVPEEISDDYITELSVDKKQMELYEVLLLSIYYLCKFRPESMSFDEGKVTDFRKKLQWLARVNQCSNKCVVDITSKMKKNEQESEKLKIQSDFLQVTNNIQLLIRELFKNPMSFKLFIIPSWNCHQKVRSKRENKEMIIAGTIKTVIVNDIKSKRKKRYRNRRGKL